MAQTDYEGDRALARKLLAEGDAEAIALAIRAAWRKGYDRGFEAGSSDQRSRDFASRRGHDMGQ